MSENSVTPRDHYTKLVAAENFMSLHEHFEKLVESLQPADLGLYRSFKHTREEAAFRNRTFIVYEIFDREPDVLDTITVMDFHCNDTVGASAEVRSHGSGQIMTVNYLPQRLFEHEVFVWMPLHAKIRWSARPGKVHGGSLAFPLVIRTASRLDRRERGVMHCETGVEYAREFEPKQA